MSWSTSKLPAFCPAATGSSRSRWYARAQKLANLRQLADRRKCLERALRPLLPPPASLLHLDQVSIKSRRPQDAPRNRGQARSYLEAVLAVVGDLEVSMEEARRVRQEREELGLPEEVVRAIHARIFGAMLERFAEENRIDATEKDYLRRLHLCLSTLGWAPGE